LNRRGVCCECRETGFHVAVNANHYSQLLFNMNDTDSFYPPITTGLKAPYIELGRFGRELQTSAGKSAGQIANFQTALNTWRKAHHRGPETLVREDFGRDYCRLLDLYAESATDSVSARTLKDRLEQLEWWRQVAQNLRSKDMLPPGFADALRAAYKSSGMTKLAICSQAGISVESMKRWLAGKGLPERNTVPRIVALETVLDVPVGTLTSRLPKTRRSGTDDPGSADTRLSVAE
jgi:DNA-binding phage protein